MNHYVKKTFNILLPDTKEAIRIVNRCLTTEDTITKPETKFIRTVIGSISKEEYDRMQYVILSTMNRKEKFE